MNRRIFALTMALGNAVAGACFFALDGNAAHALFLGTWAFIWLALWHAEGSDT